MVSVQVATQGWALPHRRFDMGATALARDPNVFRACIDAIASASGIILERGCREAVSQVASAGQEGRSRALRVGLLGSSVMASLPSSGSAPLLEVFG